MGNVQAKGPRYQGRYRDAEGTQHALSFKTEEQARAWVEAGEKAVRDGTHRDQAGARMTVEQFWFEYRHRFGHLAEASRRRMDSAFLIHILPRFGPLPFHRITFDRVSQWNQDMRADLEARTVRTNFGYFYRMLQRAADDNRFDANLLSKMKHQIYLPVIDDGPLRPEAIPTPAQVVAWTAAMPGYCALAVPLAAQTGLRAGEVLGLSTERLNMLGRQFVVDRQLRDSPARGVYLGPTKSRRSDRTLPLPQPLLEALAAHLSRYPAAGRVLPVYDRNGRRRDQEAHLVFANRDGLFLRGANFGKIAAAAALEATGIHFTFHDLRHFFASQMLAEGRMEPVDLMKALGHSRLSVTYDTYIHCLPSQAEPPQLEVMGRLFG
jgi:integrase